MFALPEELKPNKNPDRYQYSVIKITRGCNPFADTKIVLEMQVGFEDGAEPTTGYSYFTPVKDVPVFDLSLKEIQEKLTEAMQSNKITADKAHDEMTAVLNLLDQIYTFTNQAVLSLEALGLITIPKA